MQNPSAQDKAQVKTATAVAGVQEDLKGLRDRLATNEVRLLCSGSSTDNLVKTCRLGVSFVLCTNTPGWGLFFWAHCEVLALVEQAFRVCAVHIAACRQQSLLNYAIDPHSERANCRRVLRERPSQALGSRSRGLQ